MAPKRTKKKPSVKNARPSPVRRPVVGLRKAPALSRRRAQVEAALRESEERFAKVFRTSPHPIGITEIATGRCLEVNDACLQLFGFRREEVIGNTTLMLGIWPSPEDRVRLIEQLKDGEPVRNLELSFKAKSGDLRHILVSSDLVELSGTECLITVGNDITERKWAQDRLRESEERFRTMADAVPSFLFETDAAGWNIWTSEGWCRFTGQTPEQVAGHGWADALHPDDRAANLDQWLHCMEHGVPFEAKQRLHRVDGSYAWVIARALPVHDDHERVSRWVGSVTNVDNIVRAEEALRQLNETLEQRVAERLVALRESEERLRVFLENSATIAWLKDEDGRHVFLSANYEKRFGVRLSDWKGKTDFDVWPRAIAEEFRRNDLTVLADGRTREMVEQFITPNGTVSWWLTSKFVFRDESGKRYIGGLGVDISQRKRDERLLQSSEAFTREVLDSLSANVCVLDWAGVIIRTNEPWKKFAQANSDMSRTIGAVGDNYLAVCRRAIADGDTTVLPILSGIEAVLAGRQETFSAEYPCHSPDEKRWFLLRVSPLMESQGVVLSHLDISDRKRVEEALHVKQRELERSQEKSEELTAKLLMAQETEWRRLACELHDDITQRIATVAIDLQGIRSVPHGSEASLLAQIHQAGKMMEQITTDLQRLAHQLHPSLLEHVGLEAAVQEHVEEFEARTGLKTKVQVRNLPTALSLDRATCLYRVLQESLQNVRKHANATYVVIRLLGSTRGVGLCVHDDGRGFEQDCQTSSGRKGLGLISMEERVGVLQGTFRIKTKPGDGTEIHAWVPLGQCQVSPNGEAQA